MRELSGDVVDVRIVYALVFAKPREHQGLKVGEGADHGFPAREVGPARVVDSSFAFVRLE